MIAHYAWIALQVLLWIWAIVIVCFSLYIYRVHRAMMREANRMHNANDN